MDYLNRSFHVVAFYCEAVQNIDACYLVCYAFTEGVHTAETQSGNQMLDGIGEIGMIARYVFNGDLKYWSRNNVHATHGIQAKFVNGNRFGKVLLRTANSDDFITIPTEADRYGIAQYIRMDLPPFGTIWSAFF